MHETTVTTNEISAAQAMDTAEYMKKDFKVSRFKTFKLSKGRVETIRQG